MKNNSIKKNMKSFDEISLYTIYPQILEKLLFDNTTKKYLIWATSIYSNKGRGYKFSDFMKPDLIIINGTKLINPRVLKSKSEKDKRTKDMAEVFTPSWICNRQNNLIDEKWFGRKNVFNITKKTKWKTKLDKIDFGEKSWQSYILDNRLEITCGEGPYIVSRYDVVNNEYILTKDRIGFLDRKIRIINENTNNKREWYKWVVKAFQHCYGYDYQGDNVLLTRENLLLTFIDYYIDKFNEIPSIEKIMEITEIISWNIWQMDGLKFVIPQSCKNNKKVENTLFGIKHKNNKCISCEKKQKNYLHLGIYCYIFDWESNKSKKFLDILKGDINE